MVLHQQNPLIHPTHDSGELGRDAQYRRSAGIALRRPASLEMINTKEARYAAGTYDMDRIPAPSVPL